MAKKALGGRLVADCFLHAKCKVAGIPRISSLAQAYGNTGSQSLFGIAPLFASKKQPSKGSRVKRMSCSSLHELERIVPAGAHADTA